MKASSSRTRPTWSAEWATYRRMLTYAWPYRRRLALAVICGMGFALTHLGFLKVLQRGIGEIVNPNEISVPVLVMTAVLFPVVGILQGFTDYLTAYYIRWVGHRVVMDLRNAMFAHIQGLSVSYFSGSRVGELISRTANDTMLIERAVSTVVSDLAKQPLTLVLMLGFLFKQDARLAAASLVLFPVCLVPIGAFGRRVRRYSRQAQERIADVISILQEGISGVRIVKAFGMEDYEQSRFTAQTRAFFTRIMRVARASAIIQPIIVFIAMTGVALLLVYVRAVHMQVEDFFAFAAAMFMMYEPVKKLSKLHLHVQQSSAAADRIFEVLDTPRTVTDRPGAEAFSGHVREIVFDKVEFGYGDEPVLREVNLRVRAGERVALVGSSGAGKTTLVNLLPRFYDVESGSILLNGVDLRDLTLNSLRRHIGLVTQETFLFNDTVEANISYGSSQASPERIREAARRAHADIFISDMPQGYDTVVGERGVRLSGGQRQRLAIARAILRDPPILILDEATSALDTESERQVQAALTEAMSGRTVFAIAHRLSTITSCDRIFVLENGSVVEQGSHQELLALGGAYKRLYDMQFEDHEQPLPPTDNPQATDTGH